jgi:hypothetical protein
MRAVARRSGGLLAVLGVWCCLSATGCAGSGQGNAASTRPSAPPVIDPQRVQSSTMSFANGYVGGMADAFDRVQNRTTTTQAKLAAVQGKTICAMGALGNAVSPNPVAGLMDMALMVTLTRQSFEDPWAKELFGQENVDIVLTALKPREAEIWHTASLYLTPAQIAELRKLAERWRREHPQQRFVASGRLTDFAEAKQAAQGGPGIVGGVFNLVRLDPFSGLDPAVREVEESRLLAERMFFYFQYTPLILSWQIDATYLRMLEAPEVKELMKNTNTVAASTTRVSTATTQFADAGTQFANTIENFRKQLPQQQATLVDQLNELIARQRDTALKQATTQVSDLRDSTVRQLDSSVGTQQDLMAKNLQAVMDQSIEQLYARARGLVLLAVGSVLIAVVAYRLLVTAIFRTRVRR